MWHTESKLAVIAGWIAFAALGYAQVPSLTRTDYEAGIQYRESVGRAFSGCNSDDFGLRVRWGDDLSKIVPYVSVTPDSIDPPPFACGVGGCVNGWYTFTSKHIYTNPGDYTAQVINESAHCYGSSDRWTVAGTPTTVHVFPRVPLARVVSNQDASKAGQSATVTISLQRSAPASGTRVFLIVDKPELLDPKFPLPAYVEFASAGATDQTIMLHLAPVLKTADTLTLTAQAGGPARSVIININP
jgi:hypothetical protein